MADNENRVIVGIRVTELEERLASAFEGARGTGGFYSDCGGRHKSDWVNVYHKILRAFDSNQQESIESAVREIMSKPGTHRIMDQGCGHAQSLLGITQKMADLFPENEFLGYGVTADLKDMWLGGKVYDFQRNLQQERLWKDHAIQSFQGWAKNYSLFGIEEDIHKVMKQFPYELDLVFSDNAYFHLVAPWLALKRTADKLTVGGVAMVRTLFTSMVHTLSDIKMEEEEIVHNLQQDNPHYEIMSSHPAGIDHRVMIIIKREDIPFKTNHYLAWVDEISFDTHVYRNARTFYSKIPAPSPFLPIDTL